MKYVFQQTFPTVSFFSPAGTGGEFGELPILEESLFESIPETI